MNETNDNHKIDNGTNHKLFNVLSDEHIKVIAEKVALKYAYVNKHSYSLYVKAITDGIKIGRGVMSKNIT